MGLIDIKTVFMKTLGYKLKFIFSEPKKVLFNVVRNFAAIVGGLYTLVTIADAVQGAINFEGIYVKYFWTVCIGAGILSLIFSVNWIPQFTCSVDDYDIKISLEVGDVSKRKKSIIMSTNSSFATTMEHGVIMPSSVQGAFQNRYYKEDLSAFDSIIRESLAGEEKREDNLILYGKEYPRYCIGATAIFQQNNRWVHMVALNDINEHGQNQSRKIDDMYAALNGLWTSICEKGHIEDELSIPLIASGRAGIADATKECVIESIIDSFLVTVQNTRCKLTSHLRIVIYPSDLEKIDVQKMKDYLKYRCLFTKKDNGVGIGNEIP